MKKFEGKILTKLEWAELNSLGCTKEALEEKYNNSDSCYYIDNENNIYEFVRGVEFVGKWNKSNFLEFFNEILEEM